MTTDTIALLGKMDVMLAVQESLLAGVGFLSAGVFVLIWILVKNEKDF